MVLRDKTTILIKKDTHTDLLKIMGQIQARTGKIPTQRCIKGIVRELQEENKVRAFSLLNSITVPLFQ
jgi:hypothetical protein